MYVRLKANESGQLYLQQLLQFASGKGQKAEPRWENVPVVGSGATEALSLPLGQPVGVMMFEYKESYFKADHSTAIRIAVYVVSALDVLSFCEDDEGSTVITFKDKKRIAVAIDRITFMVLLTELLTTFKVIKFDKQGNLYQGETNGAQ